MSHRVQLALIALGLGVLGAALAGWAAQDDADKQPFAFNHQVHINAKVDCLQCHAGLLDPGEARFPTFATCAKCHKDPPGDDKRKQALAEAIAEKRAADWQSMAREPDHVFFSHNRHVDVANLECKTCHGDMPSRTRPPDAPHAMAMKQCMACHASSAKDHPAAARAEKDCAACHR